VYHCRDDEEVEFPFLEVFLGELDLLYFEKAPLHVV
jgi:hypothetical protein